MADYSLEGSGTRSNDGSRENAIELGRERLVRDNLFLRNLSSLPKTMLPPTSATPACASSSPPLSSANSPPSSALSPTSTIAPTRDYSGIECLLQVTDGPPQSMLPATTTHSVGRQIETSQPESPTNSALAMPLSPPSKSHLLPSIGSLDLFHIDKKQRLF